MITFYWAIFFLVVVLVAIIDKATRNFRARENNMKHLERKKRDTENCLSDWAATDPDYKNGLKNHDK